MSKNQPTDPRVRIGKTAKDRRDGANARRLSNQAQRAEWRNKTASLTSNIPVFPLHTCNGKRSRRLKK